MTALPHCKRGCGRAVPKRGMVCPACRKTKAQGGNGRSPRATNGAAHVLNSHYPLPAIISVSERVPTLFTTHDILELYCARHGTYRNLLSDREYAFAFRHCSLIADLLNGERQSGYGRIYAQWKEQQKEQEKTP